MFRHVVAACLALVAAVGFVGAAPNEPKPKPLVLSPALSPSPSLRYTLLPPLRELKPGNAAPLYHKAGQTVIRLRSFLNDPQYMRIDRWRAMPRERLRAEVKQALAYLEPLKQAFEEIEAAARCESCDWGMLESSRKEENSLGQLVNEVQRLREFAMYLSLRCKVALADDRPNDAVRDAQTMFAIVRHLSQAPALIPALVGFALTAIGGGMLEEIIQHPQAPNLYWALTDLPRPFIDLRHAIQGESVLFYSTFPGLTAVAADLNAGAIPPEKISKYRKTIEDMGLFHTPVVRGTVLPLLAQVPGLQKVVNDSYDSLSMARFVLEMERGHEAAKRALIERGRPREKVEQMPQLQVALLHSALDLQRVLDEVEKWQSFPYWEAAPALAQLQKKLNSTGSLSPETPALRLGALMMPGMTKTCFARARVERQLAVLRCIEAIRLYASAHDGKLPATLGDIKEVPVPIDPATGKAFRYSVEGDHARLSAIVTNGEYAPIVPNYELKLRR